MKKRVIQINGLGGLLMTLFVVTCLVAGFVCFPAYVSMSAWNFLAAKYGLFTTISFLGGLLLWGIIVLTFFIFNKKHLIVSFGLPDSMTKEEFQELLKKSEMDINEEILKEFDKKDE